ncbi:MAG TPA: alpha/beta fold hydrolase [Bacteroidales bacterium]|nr:alpha/beta fold hydrolase [Bacteroidales bacterium]
MKSEKVSFIGGQSYRVTARVDLPSDSEPHAFALFAHCFTCNKNLRAISRINEELTRSGYGVMRFDFTGLGESDGDFSNTNFTSNIEDLVAAAEYMESWWSAPGLLIGHSLGGAAVLQTAKKLPSVKAVVTIGAPCDPKHVTNLLVDSIKDIERKGKARVSLAGRIFTIKKQFLDDLHYARMDNNITSLNRPLLLFHSPIDQIVGIENASHLFKMAKHPKSYVSLDKADHLLSNDEDALFVGRVISGWLPKYL